jgi:hypothetical protein
MLAKPYVWVLSDGAILWTRTDILSNNFIELSNALNTLDHNIFAFAASPAPGTNYDAFKTKMAPYLQVDSSNNQEPNVYSGFAYDAALSFAYALKKLIQENRSLEDNRLLWDTLQVLKFEGATGHVAFDSNGDRFGTFGIFKWYKDAPAFTSVGTWSFTTGVTLTRPVSFDKTSDSSSTTENGYNVGAIVGGVVGGVAGVLLIAGAIVLIALWLGTKHKRENAAPSSYSHSAPSSHSKPQQPEVDGVVILDIYGNPIPLESLTAGQIQPQTDTHF